MKKWIAGVILFLMGYSLSAQNEETEFKISDNQGNMVSIVVEPQDYAVVNTCARILAEDIMKVAGKKPSIRKFEDLTEKECIIAGTLGKSEIVDRIIRENNIDVHFLKNQWENYLIMVIERPLPDVSKGLIVIGSDRRGTAYGLLEISRMIGVSPWEWWADVMPEHKHNLSISLKNSVYGSPSVKFRGIFINDEDWGLQRWAANNYEPETGDIGPKTYAKIFELMLRLRANTIWPAMHSCTKPFYFYPENKKVADDYAIVIGTSHCEPMLCNINAEWNSTTMGEWRYDNNSETIKRMFEKRINEAGEYEGIYTMGMRGEHDSPMIVGEDDTDAQVDLLENVINDQRHILEKYLKNNSKEVPQIFIPYKEVLKYYQAGMDLPQDITLVWPDDNYGYIRQLSTPDEQKRVGGAGVYYHTSYWGRPHDYLWLNSTNPVLMWEEMKKAYDLGAKNIWVLNCGDIKPHEYSVELFLDMAWDINNFELSKAVRQHMFNWATREFGERVSSEITDLYFEYYRLCFLRRPEFMAWSQVEPVTKAKETELTQIHYGDEVSTRIEQWQKLLDQVERIKPQITYQRQDAFYQLIYYPIVGAACLNHKWLYAYKNEFVASQGRASASHYATMAQKAYERILSETSYFNNELDNGKWKYIMSCSPRYLPVFSSPPRSVSTSNKKAELGVALEGYEMEVNHDIINSYADVLPVFNAYVNSTYFIDVFLKGNGNVSWTAKPKAEWIKLSLCSGTLNDDSTESRIVVSIDWDKIPVGENKREAPLGHDYQLIPPSYKVNSSIDFISGDSTISIGVSVFNPGFSELKGFNGFVEDKGYISINAENYNRAKSGAEASYCTFEGIGYSGKVVSAQPVSSQSLELTDEILRDSPCLVYDFYTFNFGEANVIVQAIPTHALHSGGSVRCALAIDESEPVIVNFQSSGRSDEWAQNVLKNAARESVKQIVNKAGYHKLKVWMVDPGVMIDQILIDLGGWKKSYAFPKESRIQ